jgi:hypothetical protein
LRYTFWRRSRFVPTIFAISVLAAVIGIGSLFSQQPSLDAAEIGVPAGVVILLLPTLLARTQFKQMPALKNEILFSMDESGFRNSNSKAEASLLWSGIDSVVELKDIFAIYPNKMMVYPVPKRLFNSDQLVALRELFAVAMKANGRTFKTASAP